MVQVSPLPFNRNGQIFQHYADKLMDLCDATRRKRGAAL